MGDTQRSDAVEDLRTVLSIPATTLSFIFHIQLAALILLEQIQDQMKFRTNGLAETEAEATERPVPDLSATPE